MLLRLILCLSAALFQHRLFADEAYIWQRQWHGELNAAVRAQSDLYTGLRVLAAQLIKRDQWAFVSVDLLALRAANLPVSMVIRLPGSQPPLTPAQLAEIILPLQGRWQAAGIPVARVEIDFDCAESKLAEYQSVLIGLRILLPKKLALDITALPAWLKSAQMPALIAAADRVTLQVHSVLAPKRGLFDPRMAEFWVREMARITDKPFSVALPAYGAKLLLDDKDQVIGVQHEAEFPIAHRNAVELTATPQSVRALIDALAQRPEKRLAGFVWFRLPLASDQRAWAPLTLRAVIEKQVLRARVQAQYPANAAGGFDVTLYNAGNLAGNAPTRLAVNPKCLGEGVAGYSYSNGVFSASAVPELKPETVRVIGWLRCPAGVLPALVRMPFRRAN
jgi:hypothetical protein